MNCHSLPKKDCTWTFLKTTTEDELLHIRCFSVSLPHALGHSRHDSILTTFVSVRKVHYLTFSMYSKKKKTISAKAIRVENVLLGTRNSFCSLHSAELLYCSCGEYYPMALNSIKNLSLILTQFIENNNKNLLHKVN